MKPGIAEGYVVLCLHCETHKFECLCPDCGAHKNIGLTCSRKCFVCEPDSDNHFCTIRQLPDKLAERKGRIGV